MKKSYLIFCICAFFVFGCSIEEKKQSKEQLEINLSLSYNNDTYFDYRKNQILILTTKEIYPNYYKEKIKSFNNN